MSMPHSVEKVVRSIHSRGIKPTVREIGGHLQRTVGERFEGTPGFYTAYRHLLLSHYDDGAVTPVWVSPSEITHLTGQYETRDTGHLDYVPFFKPREADWDHLAYHAEIPYDTVVDGNWDQKRDQISNLLMYRGVEQRFVDDYSWEETVFYKELRDRFRATGWDRQPANRLASDRCTDIENVYKQIREYGYRSQQALNGHPLHEVTVNIARDGTLLYNCEGRHRLCVAKALDLERIPVLILARHSSYDGSVPDGLKTKS